VVTFLPSLQPLGNGKDVSASWRLLLTLNSKKKFVGHSTLYCSIPAKIESSAETRTIFPYYLRRYLRRKSLEKSLCGTAARPSYCKVVERL